MSTDMNVIDRTLSGPDTFLVRDFVISVYKSLNTTFVAWLFGMPTSNILPMLLIQTTSRILPAYVKPDKSIYRDTFPLFTGLGTQLYLEHSNQSMIATTLINILMSKKLVSAAQDFALNLSLLRDPYLPR